MCDALKELFAEDFKESENRGLQQGLQKGIHQGIQLTKTVFFLIPPGIFCGRDRRDSAAFQKNRSKKFYNKQKRAAESMSAKILFQDIISGVFPFLTIERLLFYSCG